MFRIYLLIGHKKPNKDSWRVNGDAERSEVRASKGQEARGALRLNISDSEGLAQGDWRCKEEEEKEGQDQIIKTIWEG